MAKESTRALKDEVAEHLRKSNWKKAAEVLEQLARAEPKEMTHRLKLGDTYRRLEQKEKAIASFREAARFFGDEGQLIKAIGAIKVILELDPKNWQAQAQLAEMNERRLGKVTLESAGLKAPPKGIGAGARGTSAIELDDAAAAANAVADSLNIDLEAGDDEPLELEDGRPPRQRVAPAGGPAPRKPSAAPPRVGPPPKIRPQIDIGAPLDADVPARRTVEFDPEDLEAEALEELPEDAVMELEEAPPPPKPPPAKKGPPVMQPAAPPKPAKPMPAPAPTRPSETVIVSDEITVEPVRAPVKVIAKATPIADLLSGGAEEEIELLSISSDDETVGARPMANAKTPDEADLDAAFGNISPQAAPPAKRVPAKKVPLFDDLTQDAFVELVNKLEYHRHVPGQLIIREGDPGRSFYVIVEGKVRIYKQAGDKQITLAHLGEGAFFGEMALLSGAPRTANVVAEEDTEILEVTDVVLRDLATKYPQVVSSLKNFYRQRLLNNVMAISPLFKDFDPSERKTIVEKFRMKQAAPGEALTTEGRNSDGLYVVLHGAVQVAAAREGKAIALAKLKEGDIFGEMSLLTRKPATATVTAQGNVIVLRLPRENFQELVLTHPQILELVSELTEQRRSATEAILQGQGPGIDGMSFV
jgi:CRP-like cAMP-binding protein